MELQTPQLFSHGTEGVPLQTQVTMAIQVLILVMLVVALIAWRRGQLSRHGKIMGIATALSIASFLTVMLPVFNDSLSDFINDVQAGSLRAQVNLAHAVLGTVALGLSAVVTGRWAYGRFKLGKACYQKNLMRATIGMWVVALAFGVLVYLAHVLEWM
jgi:uncharacterized membrane protein YozB (DUF420 family)